MIIRLFRRIKRIARRIISPPFHRPTVKVGFYFLGTDYGGWPLLKSTPGNAMIYSFGVGEDISFDLSAIERFGCQVHAFDPTPKSVSWVGKMKLPKEFIFHPIGVAAQDGEARFAPPETDGHVSFSSTQARTDEVNSVVAPVLRVASCVERIEGQPEIIKLDVEGFEYEVIEDMIESGVRPRQLLVEFHHGLYGFKREDTLRAVDALLGSGYEIFYVSSSGREYGFVLR